MGEARRRRDNGARSYTGRSWAVGRVDVVANDAPCFTWQGTRQDMTDVMANYEVIAAANNVEPGIFARRAAGYLMVYGMPAVGDADHRPSNPGTRWDETNIETYRRAILWLALRETVPDTGYPLVNMLVGKAITVELTGDKQAILDDTAREVAGRPFSGGEFTMLIRVTDPDLQLDPDQAVAMSERKLFARADKQMPADWPNKTIYVPRIPVDSVEADAMLAMTVIFTDATQSIPPGVDPTSLIRVYAGYTEAELSRGKPAVRIR